MTDNPIKRFDELNVARLSLISVQERIPEHHREWTIEVQDLNFRYKVVCQAMPEYGVPHGVDNDISAALLNLFIEQGMPEDNAITCTPYLILTTAGLDTSGRYYAALETSLKRLVTTNYFISEGWRDHPRRRWTTASFRYIDRLEYTSEDERLDEGSILKIYLPAEIVRSVRAGYLKALDLTFMQSLKRPPTRALYRLLDARRFDPERPEQRVVVYQVGLMEWAEACKILADRPSMVVRALKPAHDELLARGYLKSVEIHGRGKKQIIEYVFGEVEQPPDPQLVAELVTRTGLTRVRASQLAKVHARAHLEDSLDRLSALLSSGFKPRSKAALFVDLIGNPDKYEIALEAQPLQSPQRQAANQRAEAARRASEQAAEQAIDEAARLPKEQQVEAAMQVLLVMLRGDLRTPEFDALRALLEEEDPQEIKRWVIKGIANNNKAAVLRDLRARLQGGGQARLL